MGTASFPVFPSLSLSALRWGHSGVRAGIHKGKKGRVLGDFSGVSSKMSFLSSSGVDRKNAPPYTPPSLETETPCGPVLRRITERAGVLPGNRTGSCVPKFRKLSFHDVDPLDGTRGQLFDIVKIEERETWTARFLRTEPDESPGRSNRLRRYVFSRGTLPIMRSSDRNERCVSSSSKTCLRRPSQISNLRV